MHFKLKDLSSGRRKRLAKTLFRMKLTSILLLISFLQVAARGTSQEVSLDVKDAPLEKVLQEIHQQSGYMVWYDVDDIRKAKRVTISVKRVSLEEALVTCFKGQPLTYSIVNSTVVVKPRKTESADSTRVQAIPPIEIKGRITDSTGNPLEGVSVRVKGATKGSSTNENGYFVLRDVSEDAELEISSVGFLTQTIKIGSRSTINLVLSRDNVQEELVTISYGTQKKATLTGSMVRVGGEDIRRSPNTNIANNLTGRLPGLSVTTPSGEPGVNNSRLSIRGTNTLGDNSPLIVVDGIPNRSFERINPNDIESITVMKDAMAAIYGSQAANGVIMVTTKRGKAGKPRITVDLSQGYNQPTKTPKMADAAQYAQMLNEISYYGNPSGGLNQRYTPEDITLFQNGTDPWGHPNTDWFGTVFKTWSPQRYANVSMNGGSENMRYFLSIGGRSEDAYYKNSATKYEQYNFRSNIDGKVSKYITVSFDVSGRTEISNFPTVSAEAIFRSLMRGKPNRPAYWPDGSPGPELEFGDQPAVTSTNLTGYDKNKWYRLESRLSVNFIVPWVKGLNIQGNASYDKIIQNDKFFQKPWYLYTWDGNPDHILGKAPKGPNAPALSVLNNDGQNSTVNAYATYETNIADNHHLKVMAGTERNDASNSYMQAERRNFLSAEVDQLFAGATDDLMRNDGYATQTARLNYFGRVNYDFQQKYLFEYVWRYDGSYIFPKNKRFGFFQGFSAGWRISQENFWKDNISFINDMKIKGSWGQTGNDRIAAFQFLSLYQQQGQTFILGVDNDNKRFVELVVPNPNVTWEVAQQTNVGFEALLLDNHLSVEASYFYNKRSNLLITRGQSTAGLTGYSPPAENIGKVDNKGYEFQVGYRNTAGEWSYNISVNGNFTKNKIVFWDEQPGVPDYQQSTGRPIGSNLYYEAIGIFQDQGEIDKTPHWEGAVPGDIIFKDVNGDGVIDGLDLIRNTHSDLPTFTGGISLGVKFKDIELSALFQGATGAQLYVHPESGEDGNYYKDFADNRWTPDNHSTTYPRAFNGNNEYWRSQSNTYWIQSTDYLRLKNLEIAYNVPLRSSKSIQALRIFANSFNLFTFDKGTLIDPESTTSQLGIPYPPQRIVNFGLSVTF